ncbi:MULTISPECIES: P-type conjugative transfer protein TrbJ [Caulobacter]|jgi:P-type conjugative transfer protein TrbJ|uniref:P-type conjugative transfer protein TrbJ n=1 Tax=Caulobacter vibrioides OR37 TaxID=1292034 RepID=R0EKF7_CAUVI|nr:MULTISPECIES: P-type conjugative transfer protein TrbJ [Caulobacter]ENZ81607.1 P-type conjugative transfer protein TrbJ [Caulobacter vibrioides OR37]PIB96953.1 P-type conjugative transfer protein TrbJ [Caulobacter sp. X]
MTLTRRRLAVAVAASLLAAAPAIPSVAFAQFTVFDPTNYAQNVLQAARALQTINNQISSLQNEAQMLIGQAKSLASLPYSSLAALQAQVDRTRDLLAEAQGLAFDVSQIREAFRTQYGAVDLSASDAVLTQRADARWGAAVAGFQDALKVQAGVVGGMGASRDQLANLVTQSQGAEGGLQAAQAGNQLLALQAQQLSDLLALSAAQGRAQALEAADRAAARADAKARFSKFMGSAGTP